MIVWFYFLWFLAIFHVLFGPLLRVATKILWGVVIIAGIWLLVGAITYQSKYTAYLVHQKEIEAEKQALSSATKALDQLYTAHQTSRDILLRLGTLSARFGEREKMLEYAEKLRDLDPNDPTVQKFLQSIQ